jgi:hypothetical protein
MKKHSIIILLAGILVFASCRKLITDTFPDMPPKPTLNAILRDGAPIEMHVSLSGKIDTVPLRGVDNATVKLFVDNVFVEELMFVADGRDRMGLYQSAVVAEQGKRYAFEVAIPEFSTVRCETYMPRSEFIRSVEYIAEAGRDADAEGATVPGIRITFTNHPNEVQYFQLALIEKARRYGDSKWDSINSKWQYDVYYIDDPVDILNISDPVILAEGLPIPVFSNRIITDTIYTMYLEFTTGSYGTGIETEDGKTVMISDPLVVELRSIDEDYYHYLRSLYIYERNIFDNAIGEIYPPHQLHSNVPGGYGLVTAYSSFIYDTIDPTNN